MSDVDAEREAARLHLRWLAQECTHSAARSALYNAANEIGQGEHVRRVATNACSCKRPRSAAGKVTRRVKSAECERHGKGAGV